MKEFRRVGFSGSQDGMTDAQVVHVHMLLGDLFTVGASQASHGLCEGSDDQFHDMAKALGYFIVGCPGQICGVVFDPSSRVCDLTMPARPVLVQKQNIVHESNVMIVTPKEAAEKTTDVGWSPVWMTVRYARQEQKPLIIVWPDGTSTVERVPQVETADQFREMLLAAAS